MQTSLMAVLAAFGVNATAPPIRLEEGGADSLDALLARDFKKAGDEALSPAEFERAVMAAFLPAHIRAIEWSLPAFRIRA